MKKLFRVNEIRLIVGLLLAGLLCVAYAVKAPGNNIVLNGADDREVAPLFLQALDYTGPCPDASSGNTTSPYCRAIKNHPGDR
jgi:hypothetical protein